MAGYEIQIDGNLYETHCVQCDEVLAIVEKNEKSYGSQNYLCENCAKIINDQRFAEQEIERLKRLGQ